MPTIDANRTSVVSSYTDDPMNARGPSGPINPSGFVDNGVGLRGIAPGEQVVASNTWAGAIRNPITNRVSYYASSFEYGQALRLWQQNTAELQGYPPAGTITHGRPLNPVTPPSATDWLR